MMFQLVLAFVFALTATASNAPVIIVPGLGGSVLKAKLHNAPQPHFWCERNADWFPTWLIIDQLLPEQKDCLLTRLVTSFNATDATYHNAPGTEIDVVDFGGIGGIAYLDPKVKLGVSTYFEPMIEYLETHLNYKRGIDLHGAPYDWRAAPDGHSAPGQFYDRLQTLIETTSKRAGGKKVHIVTHSLGGPTALMFLNTRTAGWVEQHVASFMPINAPWGGGTMMALADVSGYNFGLSAIPVGYLKPVQDSSASGVFVLPTPAAFKDTPVMITDQGRRNYTAAQLPEMLSDLGLDQAHAIMTNLDSKRLNTANLKPPPSSVSSLVFSSKGIPTELQYYFKGPFTRGMKATAPDQTVSGDGDGVVNLPSLEFGKELFGAGSGTTFMVLNDVKHFDMVVDKRVHKAIAQHITSINADHPVPMAVTV